MNTFVISLTNSTERRNTAAAQLAKAGVKFQFSDAVDGRNSHHPLFDRYDERQYILNTGCKVSRAPIAFEDCLFKGEICGKTDPGATRL